MIHSDSKRHEAEKALALLIGYLRQRTTELARQLSYGMISLPMWEHAMQAELLDGHIRASAIGRSVLGYTSPIGPADIMTGATVAGSDSGYLLKFVTEIAQGRYTVARMMAMPDGQMVPVPITPDGAGGTIRGPVSLMDGDLLHMAGIAARSALYTNKLVASANLAVRALLPTDELLHWALDGEAKHCNGCQRLAAGGPYTAETLPTVPGAGDTECLFNCRCRLEDRYGNIVGLDPALLDRKEVTYARAA